MEEVGEVPESTVVTPPSESSTRPQASNPGWGRNYQSRLGAKELDRMRKKFPETVPAGQAPPASAEPERRVPTLPIHAKPAKASNGRLTHVDEMEGDSLLAENIYIPVGVNVRRPRAAANTPSSLTPAAPQPKRPGP